MNCVCKIILIYKTFFILENGEKQSRTQQRHHRRRACERLALMPGKLDHATLVAYQVGEWNDIPSSLLEDQQSTLPNGGAPRSPSSNQADMTTDQSKKELLVMPKIRKVSHAFPLIDSPDPARTTETLNGMDHNNDDAELVDSL